MAQFRFSLIKSATKLAVAAIVAAGLTQSTAAFAAPPEPAKSPAPEQKSFATPEEAAKALADAVKAKDREAIVALFGPDARDIAESGDPVQDAETRELFAAKVAELTAVTKGDTSATVIIGRERWPFAVPLLKTDGKWKFDTEAGRQEILSRRVGTNELNTIKVCRAFVQAQNEYHALAPNEPGVREYAQKFASDEGKRNGLFWPSAEGEGVSPLGPFVAAAQAEGYYKKSDAPAPYHGYLFRILTAQGPKAPGGAHSYVVNGHMKAGFALVAYPAKYGDSGVMTFLVNDSGKVMQKDLGAKTADIAGKMKAYNPDETWAAAE